MSDIKRRSHDNYCTSDPCPAQPKVDLMTASLRMQLGLDDEPWMEEGICKEIGGDEWFPEKGGSTKEAKKICGRCEVKDQCLKYALENDERFGIWGGLSERERRRLKRGENFTPTTGHGARHRGSAA